MRCVKKVLKKGHNQSMWNQTQARVKSAQALCILSSPLVFRLLQPPGTFWHNAEDHLWCHVDIRAVCTRKQKGEARDRTRRRTSLGTEYKV